jgi:hypothetical protein
MSQKRSPQDKKSLDLDKQRRGFSEYTPSMRHGKWRRRTARAKATTK